MKITIEIILHIRNSLGSKFQPQQTTLIFRNRFPQKTLHLVENRRNDRIY